MSSTSSIQSTLFPGRIEPLLKWPGGKAAELGRILPSLPPIIDSYFEPFLGGAAVFLALSHDGRSLLNDKSPDLMAFYRSIASGDDEFFLTLRQMSREWSELQTIVARHMDRLSALYERHTQDCLTLTEVALTLHDLLSVGAPHFEYSLAADPTNGRQNFRRELSRNLTNKLTRMKAIESRRGRLSAEDVVANIECAVKSAYYMHIRYLYNQASSYSITDGLRAALFFFIREYAYAAMFRFNSQGHFNVPYGGISYNRKTMEAKIQRMAAPETRRKFSEAVLENLDFMDFLQIHPPEPGDFVFVDPPYDSDFSNYDGSSFGKKDQARLADYLVNRCRANFMVVIKNTDYISSLYSDNRLTIHYFDKKYMWTIKERNNRDVTHIMITNY